MKTKVVITVDTEPSIAGAFADPEHNQPRINEPVWGETSGKSEALGFILQTLNSFHHTATFFVETVHVCHFPKEIMGGFVGKIRDAEQDIQLHLHPCWLGFNKDKKSTIQPFTDQCNELDEDLLIDLINSGRSSISDWTGDMPNSLRTGNFSVSSKIYRAMRAAGLTIASNICVAVAPPLEEDFDHLPAIEKLAGGIHRLEGIIELPVTCFKDRSPMRRGQLRPLQITACSFEEQRAALIALNRAGASIAVIVTHPFEFLHWTGPAFSNIRPNRLVQHRFEQLCGFLADNANQFEVVPIGRFVDQSLDVEPAAQLDGSTLSATRRSVENFVNDRFPVW